MAEVIEKALFRISVNEDLVEKVEVEEDGDFSGYTLQLLGELLENQRSKEYIFNNSEEIVARNVIAMANGEHWNDRAIKIARKLLAVEKDAQASVEKLDISIKKGIFLETLLNAGQDKIIILSKIDHDEFFDETDLKRKFGLPTGKKRVQKSCAIFFDTTNSIEKVLVSDSNSKIASYWFKSFLAAEELNNSQVNTKNAFNAIDKLLQKEIKKVSPVDYWFLRNDVISYFRNEPSFTLDTFIEKLEKYSAESDEITKKMDSFIEKVKELPDSPKAKFDRQFDLDPKAVKARFKKTIILDDNFELKINGEIENIQHKIETAIDAKGNYIKIYSNNGYAEFNKLTEKKD